VRIAELLLQNRQHAISSATRPGKIGGRGKKGEGKAVEKGEEKRTKERTRAMSLRRFFSVEHQGRLNQWAHWARAQGPRIFFLFEGPPTGCGEIKFLN